MRASSHRLVSLWIKVPAFLGFLFFNLVGPAIGADPVTADVAKSVDEDGSVSVVLSGTDADGDTLTYSVVSQPSN